MSNATPVRLSRFPFLALAGVLTLAQLYLASQYNVETRVMVGSGLLVLQLIKIVPTLLRVNDLGYPPDDALWTVIPGMNLAQFWRCLGATPTDAAWTKRRRWTRQLSAFQAYGRSLPWLLATLGTAGLVTVGEGLAAGWVGHSVLEASTTLLAAQQPDSLLSSGIFGTLGFLVLYLVLQVVNRKTASRASWWPTLLVLPTLALWGAIALSGSSDPGMAPALVGLIDFALLLAWAGLVGAFVVSVQVHAAAAAREGTGHAGTIGRAVSGWAGVASAHGARTHLVLIGMQVIVPGIYYAVSYAFTDILAVLHPDRPAFQGSVTLIRGIRGTIFKILAVSFIPAMLVQMAAMGIMMGPDLAFASLFDPQLVPLEVALIEGVVFGLCGWWSVLALYAVFLERDELRKKVEAKRAAAESEAT